MSIQLPYGAARVISAIRTAGGRPMLVGGCVRDWLMDHDLVPKDIDIEVYGISDPDRLLGVLSCAGRVTEAGRQFGVFKVRAGHADIDVSLPRRDSKTGAGHRGFSVLADSGLGFAEATARRDFGVNAIMMDPVTGELTDPHGGLTDLVDGVLRHVSPAFSDDPLRVLRAVQFAARFGFTLAPETAALCRQLAPAYSELSAERVWGEWEKIGAKGIRISHALKVLAETGWEQHFPELAALHGIEQDAEWHPEGDVHVHSGLAADQAVKLARDAGLTGDDRFTVVMAALLHDLGKVSTTKVSPKTGRIISHKHAEAGVLPAITFLTRIDAPAALRRRVYPLVKEHMNCFGSPTGPAVRRLARRLGAAGASIEELVMVVGADCAGRGDPDAPNRAARWLARAATLQVQEKPVPGILTGADLIAAGMTPGPVFRTVLDAALEVQDAGLITDKPSALRWLAAYWEKD